MFTKHGFFDESSTTFAQLDLDFEKEVIEELPFAGDAGMGIELTRVDGLLVVSDQFPATIREYQGKSKQNQETIR